MKLTFHPKQQRKMCYKYPSSSKGQDCKITQTPLFMHLMRTLLSRQHVDPIPAWLHVSKNKCFTHFDWGALGIHTSSPPAEALPTRSTDSNQTTNHCGLQFNLYYLVLFCFKLISSPFCNIWNNENILNRSDNKDWLNLNWYITKKKTKQTKNGKI